MLFKKKGKKSVLFCNADGCGYTVDDESEDTEIVQLIVSQANTEE